MHRCEKYSSERATTNGCGCGFVMHSCVHCGHGYAWHAVGDKCCYGPSYIQLRTLEEMQKVVVTNAYP